MTKNKIIIIAGPTATGKTATAIELARKIKAEVINFDSLLFYRELNIGTAKPTTLEQGEIPHHMIDVCSAKSPMNAAEYIEMATPIIQNVHRKNKIAILVGGSGFYLQALLKGMFQSQTTSEDIIEKSNKLYADAGIEPFLDLLKKQDPKSFERYHANDHYRIRRACEHFWMTGEPFSSAREKMPEQDQISPEVKYNWDVFFAYLDVPKDEHYQIIQRRTQKMIELGLEQEVKALLEQGFTGKEKPLKSIGYKEMQDYLNGEFSDLEECKERISISTRQLAKAQRTWFKKIDKNEYNSLTDQAKMIEDCHKFIEG